MPIKHYILSSDGRIAEYSAEEAFKVANGLSALPQYADSRQRYIQVQFDEVDGDLRDDSLQVRIAGAFVTFDGDGRLRGADAIAENSEPISRFEHDTCVQLALRGMLVDPITLH